MTFIYLKQHCAIFPSPYGCLCDKQKFPIRPNILHSPLTLLVCATAIPNTTSDRSWLPWKNVPSQSASWLETWRKPRQALHSFFSWLCLRKRQRLLFLEGRLSSEFWPQAYGEETERTFREKLEIWPCAWSVDARRRIHRLRIRSCHLPSWIRLGKVSCVYVKGKAE